MTGGVTIKVEVDTSELDEAIVKAKILNEELEKAKSIVNEMASSNNSKSSETKVIQSLNVNSEQGDVNKLIDEIRFEIRSAIRY